MNFHSDEISTSTFFCKSITTSYGLCENQSWSGGYITKEAISAYARVISELEDDYLISLISVEAMQRRHFLKKFIVPQKKGKASEEYCINWVSWLNPKESRDNLISTFAKHNKRTDSNRVKK